MRGGWEGCREREMARREVGGLRRETRSVCGGTWGPGVVVMVMRRGCL